MSPRSDLSLSSENSVETLLLQSRENLDFALQSARMGTWEISLDTQEINCSQEMLDLWGVSAQEFNHRRSILQSKVHPDDLEKMVNAINFAIEHQSVYELEYRIFPSSHEMKWVLSRGRCTSTPSRFAGVVFDITERKLNEQALEAAIKARDQFFMVASHELKTPLTCLWLQVEVLEWELKEKKDSSESSDLFLVGLKKQKDHLLRLSRLVDNMIDESKITEGHLSLQLEEFDLCHMVKEVLEQFKVTASKAEVDIHFTVSESSVGNWDRFRLEQVLLNLLMNAIRYGEKKPVHIEVKKEANQAYLIIRDQGMGIKSEDQELVFERFERAISENQISGMGLGLFISNNIVKEHGGKILLQSQIGKGSEFTVSLPCHQIQ